MINLFLQIVVLLSLIVIVARAEPALNRMNGSTPILVRIAFHLLTVGAVGGILFILSGEVPHWHDAIVSVGVAVLFLCERRMRLFMRPQRRRAHE